MLSYNYMAENEFRTEVITRQMCSKYLSEEFVDRAPIELGIDELIQWIDSQLSGVLKSGIKGHQSKSMPQNTPIQAKDFINKLFEDEANTYSDVLNRYALCCHRIITFKSNGESRKAAIFEEWRKGMSFIIGQLGLNEERVIIDELFDRASAISFQGVDIGEK